MPLVIKAVALALRRHPALNASLDDEKEEIVYKEYVNVGVAVDTPRGLVVPVASRRRPAVHCPTGRVAGRVAGRARAAEFALDEVRGGTFTISNLGAVGGTYATPIINHPEAAILLVGRARAARGPRRQDRNPAHAPLEPLVRSPPGGRRRGRTLPQPSNRISANAGPAAAGVRPGQGIDTWCTRAL